MKDENVSVKIKKISNLMKREIEKEIKAEDSLTKNQSHILGFLKHEKNKDIFQKDIEEELSIRRSTATEILNLMEAKGLIIRVKSKDDARLKKLILTEKGISLEAINHSRLEKIENKIKSSLTDEEINTLFHILNKIERKLLEERKR